MRLRRFSIPFAFVLFLVILITPLAALAQASLADDAWRLLSLSPLIFGALGLGSLSGLIGACIFARSEKDDSLRLIACCIAAFCGFWFGFTFIGFIVGIILAIVSFIACKVAAET